MTDNRWQVGIAGNYTNEDDEAVRKSILDAQKKFGCSGSEAAKWLILQATANAHLQEGESMRELTAKAQTVQADNSAIVEALQLMLEAIQIMRESNDVGLARVADKLDNISVNVVQAAIDDTQTLPSTMETRPVEWEAIDPNVPTPFLRGIKNVAKPGMRLQE